MSGWLIAATGVAYAWVAIEMALSGKWPLAIVWAGYAFAQIGLYIVSRQG
jgi:hypothetical protein